MSKGEHLAEFTRADLEFIDEHPDMTAADLAEHLGMNSRSIAIARARMNSDRVADPWTREDDDFIRATPHLTQHQVGRYLGRSSTSVKSRRRMLARLEGMGFGGSGPVKNPHHVGGRPLVAKTCTKCGLLLAGAWFHKHPRYRDGQWSSRCKKCHSEAMSEYSKRTEKWKQRHGQSEAGRASSAKMQAMTVDHATRAGELWVGADDAVLRDPTLTLVEKALKLGRTYHATSAACTRYGYKSRRDGLGDPERDRWIIHVPADQEAQVERLGSRS